MTNLFGYLRISAILFAFSLALCACDNNAPTPSAQESPTPTAEPAPTPEPTPKDLGEQAKRLYEKAKETGEQVPEEIMAWAKSDLKNIGTWEYKIISVTHESEDEILQELNELGSQRWECFWVESSPEGKRFYMKKPIRSYLQMAAKASKVIPVPEGGQ